MLTLLPLASPVSSATYFLRGKGQEMLLNGVNHVAILTADAARLLYAFVLRHDGLLVTNESRDIFLFRAEHFTSLDGKR